MNDKTNAAPTQGADARLAYVKLTNSPGFDGDGNSRYLADPEIMEAFDQFFGQDADDTQVVIAGLNALLHDAQDEIARLTATQGADAQTFVGKWRDVIKNMPDTYTQGADGESSRPVASDAARELLIEVFARRLDLYGSGDDLTDRIRTYLATCDAAPSDATAVLKQIASLCRTYIAAGGGAWECGANDMAIKVLELIAASAPREKT